MSGCEIHFTEGFTGQRVEVRLADQIICDTVLQSQFQTGLAHIAELDVSHGDEIVIALEGENPVTCEADPSEPFIIVRRDGSDLTVSAQADRPGYV